PVDHPQIFHGQGKLEALIHSLFNAARDAEARVSKGRKEIAYSQIVSIGGILRLTPYVEIHLVHGSKVIPIGIPDPAIEMGDSAYIREFDAGGKAFVEPAARPDAGFGIQVMEQV